MWTSAAADENSTRGTRSCRTGQLRNSPRGTSCSPSSANTNTPRSGYMNKVIDLEGLGIGTKDSEHFGASICQIVMLFLGLTMFTSTVVLLGSAKDDQVFCFVPRVGTWGSSQLRRTPSQALTSEEGDQEEFISNNKAWLLKQVAENGTTSCGNMQTAQAIVFGFEFPFRGNIRLKTNQLHQILLVSYTKDGIRRCSGGDFYETDLSGVNWKYRPRIKDLGDGSYLVNLKVGDRMAGIYTLKVVLLFSNLHGLDHWPEAWVQEKEVIHLQLEFIDHPPMPPAMVSKSKLELCTQKDFQLGAWQGRWTREIWNESCASDPEGRFKCLDPDEPCEGAWCEGPLGRLESNGWVYSAHCAFRIFTQTEAWGCLKGRWLLFWGDSNHQDTIRNLLNFVLGCHEGELGRTFHSSFRNPENSSEVLNITSYFNGHYEESGNNLGLNSLNNSNYRDAIWSSFLPSNHEVVPDTVILNSGLHDGKSWPNLSLFAEGAHNAAMFWGDIWNSVSPSDKSLRPKMLFRTTVAPAGESRKMPANPHKMEVFNTILGEELVSTFSQESLKIIDAYDMTFPWHYDNMYSDGGHYGRPPSLNSWQGITTGHQYFVDVMLVHVLLNAICPS
ncbi:unnamed protein product [Calypogeia fissa]